MTTQQELPVTQPVGLWARLMQAAEPKWHNYNSTPVGILQTLEEFGEPMSIRGISEQMAMSHEAIRQGIMALESMGEVKCLRPVRGLGQGSGASPRLWALKS